MTMLHQWFRSEYRLGFAEGGERCTGCHKYFERMTTIVIMRYFNEDARMWGPPVETWHEFCYDTCHLDKMRADDVPKIGQGGGKNVRKDKSGGEFSDYPRWH